jgi:hypothetical protein
MAEPKKETIRIAVPPGPEQTTSAPNLEKRDTARIVLPTRTPPVTPVRRVPPKITQLPSPEATTEAPGVLPRRPPVSSPSSSPLLEPMPKPPGVERDVEPGPGVRLVPPGRDENSTAPSVNRGPKKETARINILPSLTPAAAPAVNMAKTQPLLIHPVGTTPVAPVVITSKPVAPLDVIPRSLAWTIFAVSALIFLIQIWNYVVS